ncbi:hypothetical protein ACP4OV_012810 [Aristida adscensionis]
MARASQTLLLLTIALLVLITSDGYGLVEPGKTMAQGGSSGVVLPDKCMPVIIGRGNPCMSEVCPAICAKEKGQDSKCVPEGCSCTFCW